MNIEDPEDGTVAVEELAQAREIFFRSKATMLLALEELEKSESPTRSVKDAVSVGQEFLKALNTVWRRQLGRYGCAFE